MNLPIENSFQVEEKTFKRDNILEYLESSELNKLYEALAKTQLEMELAKTDKKNCYKGSFAGLKSLVTASRGYLAKNGLCVIQRTFNTGNGSAFLHTRMGHSSGQWMASNIEIKPQKGDIQSLGSYLTYLRRYQYTSLVGVITDEDDKSDDDGEEAMKATRIKNKPTTKSLNINRTQLETLSKELSNNPDILERILNGYKIQSISDLPT